MAETDLDEAKRTRRTSRARRYLLAIAAAVSGIIATLAAVPPAANFVRDAWCWARGCSTQQSPPQRQPGQRVQTPAAPTHDLAARPTNADNACYFDYMMFGSRSNVNMRLTSLPAGRYEVFTLIMMDCNPTTGEFDLRRQGSGIWGYHSTDSYLFNGILHLEFHHWVGRHSIACSFDSARRKSIRAFEGILSCTDENPASGEPRASSRNEQVTVTLYECDSVCREVVMRGEFENNGHGPQEWLKGVGEPAH